MSFLAGGIIKFKKQSVRASLEAILTASLLRGQDGYGIAGWSEGIVNKLQHHSSTWIDLPDRGVEQIAQSLDRGNDSRFILIGKGLESISSPQRDSDTATPLIEAKDWLIAFDGPDQNRQAIIDLVSTNAWTPSTLALKIVGNFALLGLKKNGDMMVIRRNRGLYRVIGTQGMFFVSDPASAGMLSQEYEVGLVHNRMALSYSQGSHSWMMHPFQENIVSVLPVPNPNKYLVLCGGGMDSAVTLALLAKRVPKAQITALVINYGQPAFECEFKAVERQINLLEKKIELRMVSLPQVYAVDDNADGWIPTRNLMMLAYAMQCAERTGIETVMFGGSMEDSDFASDNDAAFTHSFNQLLQNATLRPHYRVVAPMENLNRWEIALLGSKLGLHWHDVVTCERPKFSGGPFLSCGICSGCVVRRLAFARVGLVDSMEYQDTDSQLIVDSSWYLEAAKNLKHARDLAIGPYAPAQEEFLKLLERRATKDEF